jgi:TPR repeat protein
MIRKRVLLISLLVLVLTILVSGQQNNSSRVNIEELISKAEKGDASAQAELSRQYFLGINVAKDMAECERWARISANQGYHLGQFLLGMFYDMGGVLTQDKALAVYWFRKSAEQGYVPAQEMLGRMLWQDRGSIDKKTEGVEWLRKAAERGSPGAQAFLGLALYTGEGVEKDLKEATSLWRKAADQNNKTGQMMLGAAYAEGTGVSQDYVIAYFWLILAAANGETNAAALRDNIRLIMTPQQIAQGQQLAREFKPQKAAEGEEPIPWSGAPDSSPTSSGTGFIITEDGYLVTNQHVIGKASQVRLVTNTGIISARLIKVDTANDIALLKAEGRFSALPIVPSRMIRLGSTVATVGFPNVGLQGFTPKLAKGEIASLAGAQDDPRYFQISVPVQPGNSGGALVDEMGNVIGIVSAKLSASAALETSGELPENVNYAVKSSFLLGFLESVPDISNKLMAPNTITKKFEDIVRSAEKSAVLVLVYK